MTSKDSSMQVSQIDSFSDYCQLASNTSPKEVSRVAAKRRLKQSVKELCTVLKGIASLGSQVDGLKRSIFYGCSKTSTIEKLNSIKKDSSEVINEERASDCSHEVHAVLGVCTEAGEAAETLLKYLTNIDEKLDTGNLDEEFGDIEWYIAEFMSGKTETSPAELLGKNIHKLSSRFPDKFFDPEKAINRKHEEESKIFKK